ncbi:MAG TPA: ATP phosphoribosyltransferase [Calditrichia bacterium]|nr:ATP phosphoribosyltransferase [Calditrichota bacterium]HQU74726.1 ATP phosphoribosyltransferase [Calditrichia bacterium]HQV33364.1 ATP phosphoribosyltransferase [Calditrichia bacterium]
MQQLRMVLPKGRIYARVVQLLDEAGIRIDVDDRAYRPIVNDPEMSVKIMKPQNIPQLLEMGSHDIGFTGQDWIAETGSKVEVLMDLGFDPVRIVAAAPAETDPNDLKKRRIVVASEYQELARQFLEKQGYDFMLLRTYGATEVFPPDDADMIVDNTATGRTLAEQRLNILEEVMRSSTCLVANPTALQDPWKAAKIARIQMLFRAILDARGKVMLEMNVGADLLDRVIAALPAMRSPTVAPLFGEKGYAVKVAVSRDQAVQLIPRLKEMGAGDILEYDFKKVVI